MNEVKRLNIESENFQEMNKNENGVTTKRTPVLPYAGEKDCSIGRSVEKETQKITNK